MKSYGEWLHSDPTKLEIISAGNPAQDAEKLALREELDAVRQLMLDNDPYLGWTQKEGYSTECRCCQKRFEVEDIAQYNQDMRYCGGSERCIP